jgi:hypothetical protein
VELDPIPDGAALDYHDYGVRSYSLTKRLDNLTLTPTYRTQMARCETSHYGMIKTQNTRFSSESMVLPELMATKCFGRITENGRGGSPASQRRFSTWVSSETLTRFMVLLLRLCFRTFNLPNGT